VMMVDTRLLVVKGRGGVMMKAMIGVAVHRSRRRREKRLVDGHCRCL